MRVAILSACCLVTLTPGFASANPLGWGRPSMTAAQDPRPSRSRWMIEVGFRGGFGGGGFDRGGFHNEVVVDRNVDVGGYRGGYGWGGAAVGGAVAGAAIGTAVGAAASTAYATDPYPYGYPYPAY